MFFFDEAKTTFTDIFYSRYAFHREVKNMRLIVRLKFISKQKKKKTC